jgi:hypothetical protein
MRRDPRDVAAVVVFVTAATINNVLKLLLPSSSSSSLQRKVSACQLSRLKSMEVLFSERRDISRAYTGGFFQYRRESRARREKAKLDE